MNEIDFFKSAMRCIYRQEKSCMHEKKRESSIFVSFDRAVDAQEFAIMVMPCGRIMMDSGWN